MHASLHVLSFAFVSIVFCADTDKDAKLRYFYSSMENYTELPLDEADRIFKFDWYDPIRETVIFAHGFTGRPGGPAVAAVIDSYLKQGGYNVVLLVWQHMAASVQPSLPSSYVSWAAPNARKLGPRIADTLRELSAAGLDLNRTQLVGHSLGAHIFGIAGNRLAEKKIMLPWCLCLLVNDYLIHYTVSSQSSPDEIIGLDPAGTGFEGRPLPMRLNPNSAAFVAVIHSDPSKYGFSRALGTVDFWPNYRNGGPVKQPGCDVRSTQMFSKEDLCNHNRCWQLLIDSLKYPGTLLGSYAKNYRIWKNYSEEERNAVVLEIGKRAQNIVPGNYYFVTKNITPYGLGTDGL